MKLIFLDIDGVLNDHSMVIGYCRIEQRLAQLFQSSLEATDAQFVVSSAWRYMVHSGSMTLGGFRNLFWSHGIDGARLAGITAKDTNAEQDCRGELIAQWIAENVHEPLSYVVIDDLDLGISKSGHPFIQTESNVGLTMRQALEVNDILGWKRKEGET